MATLAEPHDPRATDSVSRYALPYPLAALYRLAHANHEASARFGFALRLAEGVFRFLALVNLADAAAGGAPVKQMADWLQLLEAPGMGKLLGLVRSTAQYLATRPPPFLAELPAALGAEWETAANGIVEVRNRWTHEEVQVTNLEAGPLLEELTPFLRTALRAVQFLGRYRLGTAQGLRATGNAFTYFWYASRGMEETCEPVALKGQAPVVDNVLMLLCPERGEGLYLAPFFYWGLTRGDRAAHVSWLYSLERRADGGQVGRYRHPVLRQDVVRGLPDPGDPDGTGVSVKEYLKRMTGWPGKTGLQLHPECAARLRDPLAPATFQERYRVVGKLGEGGMGTVYEVEDTILGRRCALKVLHGDYVRSPHVVRRFLREGKVLAQIKHPGVVEVFDFGISPEQTPYLVMALVDGEDLEQRVARAGPLTVNETVMLLTEVLEALEAIHRAGVVHRDIKPSNLIVSAEEAWVVDFGIAAVPDGTRLTQTMDRMGTVNYMAPEQWDGEFSPQSDVYACGRVLFTLLAGRCPKRPDEPLREAAPGVPRPVEQVYEIATAPDPRRRYPSARAMAEALQAALELDEGPAELPQSPQGGSPLAEIFQRVERNYPLPIARAVHDLPFRVEEETRGGGLDSAFSVLELILQYLVWGTLARLREGASRGMRERLRFIERPTLGMWVAVLRESRTELQGRDEPPLPRAAEPLLEGLVQLRNQFVHTRGGVPLTWEETREAQREVVARLGELLHGLSFLEQKTLYIVGVSPPDGRAGPGAVRAMGASPSGWSVECLTVPEPGLYIQSERGPLSLAPFARLGARIDEVLLLSGMRRLVPEYLSTHTWERRPEEDERIRADVRRALFLDG